MENRSSRSPRIKLLVLASTYPRWEGDAEPGFVHELSKRLAGQFDVTVLCPHANGALNRETMDGVGIVRYHYAPVALEVLVNDGGIITNLKRRRFAWLLIPGFVLSQAFSIWRLVRKIRPDIIHAHWLVPQGLLIATMGSLGFNMPPFIVTSHGADLFALRGRVFSSLKRFVLRHAVATTVVSEAMRTEVGNLGADISSVAVESMGVDLKHRFRPDPTVPRERHEILFVGRLVEKKGLRYLIDAMPKVLAKYPSAVVTVAGFGPEEAACHMQVRRLGIQGRFHFLGAVSQDQLPSLYRRATVFVAPFVQALSGDQEGLGLVVVEALGCGCQVVVTNLPATRALAGTPGVRSCAPGDSNALALEVIRAIAQPLDVPKSAVDSFDWTVRAQAYSRLLHAALDNRVNG